MFLGLFNIYYDNSLVRKGLEDEAPSYNLAKGAWGSALVIFPSGTFPEQNAPRGILVLGGATHRLTVSDSRERAGPRASVLVSLWVDQAGEWAVERPGRNCESCLLFQPLGSPQGQRAPDFWKGCRSAPQKRFNCVFVGSLMTFKTYIFKSTKEGERATVSKPQAQLLVPEGVTVSIFCASDEAIF